MGNPVRVRRSGSDTPGKGADVDAQGGEYGNTLQVASVTGYENVVRMLLDSGANPEKLPYIWESNAYY